MSLLREPLVHFLLAAAAIVAVDAWIVTPAERTIRVPADAVARVVADREAELGRALSGEERADVIRALGDNEILRREAVERGLDRGAQVRALLEQRMRSLLATEPPEPTEEDLRAWYDAHPDRFVVPGRTDFDQAFFADEADVPADLLATLEAGAGFWSIGDPLGPSASVRGASDPEIRGTYGAVFAERIAGAPPGRWIGPLPSKAGVHFVRVLARTAAASVPFEEARARVRDDWRRVRREASVERELEGMRSRYRVVVDGAE